MTYILTFDLGDGLVHGVHPLVPLIGELGADLCRFYGTPTSSSKTQAATRLKEEKQRK